MVRDSTPVKLGKLCPKKHKHQNLNQSLRYAQNYACIECEAEKDSTERAKIWHQANRGKVRQHKKKWRDNNLDHVRALQHTRRASKKQALVISFTESDWLKKYRHQFKGCCAYCQKRISFSELTQDHIIPLKLGGQHALFNVVPSCVGCNQSKSASLVFEWLSDSDRSLPYWLSQLLTTEWFILAYAEAIEKSLFED